MKIRVQGNPLFIDAFNAMGANGIAMDTGEIFSALQTGVIDGAENNPPTLLEHNHFQNAKYYTLTEHLILPEPIVMSKITWNKLTPAQQLMVKNAAKAAQADERVLWDKKSASSEEKLKAAGVEFIRVDKQPFYDAHRRGSRQVRRALRRYQSRASTPFNNPPCLSHKARRVGIDAPGHGERHEESSAAHQRPPLHDLHLGRRPLGPRGSR